MVVKPDLPQKFFLAVLLGPPNAGKKSLATKIAKTFNFEYVPFNERLKANLALNTVVGQKARFFAKRKLPLPDELLIDCVRNEIGGTGERNMLLNGFPQNEAQARSLDAMYPIGIVMNLRVPEEILIDRALKKVIKPWCTREQIENQRFQINVRLSTYNDVMDPVVKYFRMRGILWNFYGEHEKEIWLQIKNVVQSRMYG